MTQGLGLNITLCVPKRLTSAHTLLQYQPTASTAHQKLLRLPFLLRRRIVLSSVPDRAHLSLMFTRSQGRAGACSLLRAVPVCRIRPADSARTGSSKSTHSRTHGYMEVSIAAPQTHTNNLPEEYCHCGFCGSDMFFYEIGIITPQ